MKCTLMGHPREFRSVRETYDFFDREGAIVVSPLRPDIEDIGAYIRWDLDIKNQSGYESDRARDLMDILLRAVEESDFVYVINPLNDFDYMQTFVAGYAHGLGKHMFSSCRVEKSPAGNYVKVFSPDEALEFMRAEITR